MLTQYRFAIIPILLLFDIASTTTTTATELPEQCTNYNVLESHTRNYMTTEDNFCDGSTCCDRPGYDNVRHDWKGRGWYRVTKMAGTRIIDFPVHTSHCGTYITGWLSGDHPSPGEGLVTRTVCFNYGGIDCYHQSDVAVLNCNDAYFVYYLEDAPFCDAGYCTE